MTLIKRLDILAKFHNYYERAERAKFFAFLRLIRMLLRDLNILFVSHILCPYNTSFRNPHYNGLDQNTRHFRNVSKLLRASRASEPNISFFLHLINILFVEISDLNILLVNNIFYRYNNVLVFVTLML